MNHDGKLIQTENKSNHQFPLYPLRTRNPKSDAHVQFLHIYPYLPSRHENRLLEVCQSVCCVQQEQLTIFFGHSSVISWLRQCN